MYSPQFQYHQEQQQQQAAYYYGSTPYHHHSQVDTRRVSYTDYLSGQSEGSASENEQSTPSPLNVYEEYTTYNKSIKEKYAMPCQYIEQQQYQHHQHQHHPFAYGPPLYHDATTHMMLPMPVPQNQNLATTFYYPTTTSSMLEVPCTVNAFEYPPTHAASYMSTTDAFHPAKQELVASEAFSTPTLEKDEQASFRSESSRSSSPDITKVAVPLKSSCSRQKVTKSRSKRGDASSAIQKNPLSNSEMIDIKTFKCEYAQCDRSFKRSEHLKRHIRSIHTKEKPYTCPYLSCAKSFARSDNLSQHIRIHRPNKEKTSRARKVEDL